MPPKTKEGTVLGYVSGFWRIRADDGEIYYLRYWQIAKGVEARANLRVKLAYQSTGSGALWNVTEGLPDGPVCPTCGLRKPCRCPEPDPFEDDPAA